MSDFITVSSFSFSELEEQLNEARDKVRGGGQASARCLPHLNPTSLQVALLASCQEHTWSGGDLDETEWVELEMEAPRAIAIMPGPAKGS